MRDLPQQGALFERVLIGIDTQEPDPTFLPLVKGLASPGADIVLGHIVPVDSTQAPSMTRLRTDLDRIREQRVATATRRLDGLARDFKGYRVQTAVREGHVASTLAELAMESHAELVVVGAHTDQANRAPLLGSTARSTVAFARHPLLIARGAFPGKTAVPRTIVVATDFNAADDAALGWCREYSKSVASRVHLVHVVDSVLWWEGRAAPTAGTTGKTWAAIQEGHREKLALAAEAFGARVQAQLLQGRPRDEVLALLKVVRADLLVVGRNSQGDAVLPMGSVCLDLVDAAPCSVLVWPPKKG